MTISTRWAAEVSPQNALPGYPRPQMVRKEWQNLNGLWSYEITTKGATQPVSFDGQILVPFPIESSLSGVQKPLLPDQRLWYKRSFKIPALKNGRRLVLHFGAVDQQTMVFVNGKEIGSHSGGYDSFEFDITSAIHPGDNELIVSVWDPTDKGDAPHGKQTLTPRWTRYTAVSGIWQTVWLETVPPVSIAFIKLTPNIDSSFLSVAVNTNATTSGYSLEAFSKAAGYSVGDGMGAVLKLPVPGTHLWSPENPFLYDLTIRLRYKGKIVDSVSSYFGMRKIEIRKDSNGIERIFLNNRYYYNLGVLDQGYWPDGLYTAPTDEALKFDIETLKAMGFNTIRKHVKIEPARWYYHCDRLGMLVWQDMPSWRQPRLLPDQEKLNFEAESARHLKNLYNYPSIIMWCIFNEDWGSFDQERIAKWMKETDPSRIINANSGSFQEDYSGSELADRHMYPDPTLPPYEAGKAMVCGEYGGTYVGIPGHEWFPGKGWGHNSPPGFTLEQRYEQMIHHLLILQKEGLSASIFTEPYDVEIEENGLITYDRKVFKIPVDILKKLNNFIAR